LIGVHWWKWIKSRMMVIILESGKIMSLDRQITWKCLNMVHCLFYYLKSIGISLVYIYMKALERNKSENN